MKRKKYGSLIFNIIVMIICIGIIFYCIFSERGLSDLLKNTYGDSKGLNWFWVFLAAVCHICNSLIDSLLTYHFIRYRYKHISFFDAMKVAMTGHFFSAVTPGASGGQPMQVYAMSKMNIDVGYGTSIMIQKFIVYQITATVYSVIAIILNFNFIISSMKGGFSWAFVIIGLSSQIVVMAILLIVSFSPKLSEKLLRFTEKIFIKFKYKKVEGKIASWKKQIDIFHKYNKALIKNHKLLIISYSEVIVMLTFGFAVPYCVYRSFNFNDASMFQMISSQAFVTMVSSMIPSPGASGAAELSFTIFFAPFFINNTMKSAILLWRTISYYGTIIVCAPFALITKGHGKALTKITNIKEGIEPEDSYINSTEILDDTNITEDIDISVNKK